MSYYSNVMISATKKDFNRIEEVLKEVPNNYLLEGLKIVDYTENGIECVFAHFGYIQYKKAFEEVQMLEKCLSELQDGYVFCRLGEQFEDIDFRKRTEHRELMKEFDFIINVSENLNKELKGKEEEEFE